MDAQTQTIAISKETVAEMPVVTFPGSITVVDTPEMARVALRELTRARVVGFDTETRPSFHRGRTHNVALMQLSTLPETDPVLNMILHAGHFHPVQLRRLRRPQFRLCLQ